MAAVDDLFQYRGKLLHSRSRYALALERCRWLKMPKPEQNEKTKKQSTAVAVRPSFAGEITHQQPFIEKCSEKAEEVLLQFLHRVLQWLRTNHARVINIFRKFDSDEDNRLSGQEFACAMRMMEAPATRCEIEQLVEIIDSGERKMNILDFDRMIRDYQRKLLMRKSIPNIDAEECSVLMFSPSRVSVKCPHCDIGVAEPPAEWNPRYINLKAILAPFKDLTKHPAHAELKVTESTSIHGLKQLIREHLGEAIDSVALFKEASCNKANCLPPSWCLEHCGLSGGLETDPTSAVVYYDYVPLLGDCPILMNDSHIRSTGIS